MKVAELREQLYLLPSDTEVFIDECPCGCNWETDRSVETIKPLFLLDDETATTEQPDDFAYPVAIYLATPRDPSDD